MPTIAKGVSRRQARRFPARARLVCYDDDDDDDDDDYSLTSQTSMQQKNIMQKRKNNSGTSLDCKIFCRNAL